MPDKYPTWRINVTVCLNGVMSVEIIPSHTFEQYVAECGPMNNGADARSTLLDDVQNSMSGLLQTIEANEHVLRHQVRRVSPVP